MNVSNVCKCASMYLQESVRHVIECLFPHTPFLDGEPPITKVTYHNTWATLKAGRAFHSPVWLELLAGSRAEGLHLAKGQGPAASDRDIMYLYGGTWGVHVESGYHGIDPNTSALVMEQAQCPPGYCQVRMPTVEEPVIQCMAQTLMRGKCQFVMVLFVYILFGLILMRFPDIIIVHICVTSLAFIFLFIIFIGVYVRHPFSDLFLISRYFYLLMHYLRNLPLFRQIYRHVQIGPTHLKECIVDRDGKYFLSSAIVLNVLRDTNAGKTFKGPSQTSSDTDRVPALVCSAPFPWITEYVSRSRSSDWPSKDALEEIGILPGLLVPTGKKDSVDRDLQWRQSCSLLELRLADDMPVWVKAAFRAFKATMKYFKKRIRDNDSRGTVFGSRFITMVPRWCVFWKNENRCETDASVVCSFHLKTVLLWQLEEVDTWRHMCSFRLMIQLLVRLDRHLETGHLPHYFNIECDLLDNLHEEELLLTRRCVKVILSDPVDAMVKACAYSSGVYRSLMHWFSNKPSLHQICNEFHSALASLKAQSLIIKEIWDRTWE